MAKEIRIVNANALKVFSVTDTTGVYGVFSFSVNDNGTVSLVTTLTVKGAIKNEAKLTIEEALLIFNRFYELLNLPEEKRLGQQLVVTTGYFKGLGTEQQTIKGSTLRLGISKEGDPWLSVIPQELAEGQSILLIKLAKKTVMTLVNKATGQELSPSDQKAGLVAMWVRSVISFIENVATKLVDVRTYSPGTSYESGNKSQKDNSIYEI